MACKSSGMCRVGQNHIFIGMYGTYGHIRCRYTVLANPRYVPQHSVPVVIFACRQSCEHLVSVSQSCEQSVPVSQSCEQ